MSLDKNAYVVREYSTFDEELADQDGWRMLVNPKRVQVTEYSDGMLKISAEGGQPLVSYWIPRTVEEYGWLPKSVRDATEANGGILDYSTVCFRPRQITKDTPPIDPEIWRMRPKIAMPRTLQEAKERKLPLHLVWWTKLNRELMELVHRTRCDDPLFPAWVDYGVVWLAPLPLPPPRETPSLPLPPQKSRGWFRRFGA